MKRRNFIKTAVTAVSMISVPSLVLAEKEQEKLKSANEMSFHDAFAAIVENSNKVKFTIPSIPENGMVVPVRVEVDYPMEKDNYVKSIHILSIENSNTRTIDFFLTPANGEASFKTKIKLSKSQKVMVIVGLSNGTFLKAEKATKVTITAC